jgi:hypothetical protein
MKIKSRIKFLLSIAQSVNQTGTAATTTSNAAISVPALSQSSTIFSNCQNFWGANNFPPLYSIANILNKAIALASGNNINLERINQGNISITLGTDKGSQILDTLCKDFINKIIKLTTNNAKNTNIENFKTFFSNNKGTINNKFISEDDKGKILTSLNIIITNLQAK